MRKLIFLLCFAYNISYLEAQPSATELLEKSKKYYSGINNSSFKVMKRFKSALNSDTTETIFIGMYSLSENGRMLKLQFDNELYNLYDEKRSYFINTSRGDWYSDNSKENRSSVRLKEIPYWIPDFYFRDLSNQITNSKSTTKITSLNSKGFEIMISFKDELNKIVLDSLYRIINLKQVIVSHRYGTQYKEYTFQEFDSSIYLSLFDELHLIEANYKHNTSKNISKQIDINRLVGNKINIDSLRAVLALDSSSDDFLFIDFFHKSCLPCIKSIPELISLRNSSEVKGLMIYGIDPIIEDASNWEKFIELYKINYSIVDGEKANRIKRIIFRDLNFGFPTSVIISPDGKILYVKEGYKKGFTKQIEKLVN
jgi:cytochrome c biogenesis protein CcmG/thiol:disulfide interchange protein DsbE